MPQTNYLYQQPQLCRNQAQLAQELGSQYVRHTISFCSNSRDVLWHPQRVVSRGDFYCFTVFQVGELPFLSPWDGEEIFEAAHDCKELEGFSSVQLERYPKSCTILEDEH